MLTFIIQSRFIKYNLFQKSKIFLHLRMIIVLQSNLGIFLEFYEIEPTSVKIDKSLLQYRRI